MKTKNRLQSPAFQGIHSHGPRYRKSRVFPALLFLALALGLKANAQWTPTAAGTYDYNNTSNWNGGTINGVFSAALAGSQTITFGTATTLTSGLDFSYISTFNTTLQSASTTNENITLDGNIVTASGTTAVRTITIGGAADPLTLVLGGNETVNSSTNTNVLINALVTDGGSGFSLNVSGGQGDISNSVTIASTANSFSGNFTLSSGRVNFASLADAGVNSSLGSGSQITLGSAATGLVLFEYTGATGSTVSSNRTINVSGLAGAEIVNNTNNMILSGTIAGVAGASRTLIVAANAANTNLITLSGQVQDPTSGGTLVLNLNGSVAVTGSNNNYTGGTDLSGATPFVSFTSLANTGVNSSLGAGGDIFFESTSNGTLSYQGSTNSTSNHELVLDTAMSGTATLDSSGAGSITYTGIMAMHSTSVTTLALTGTNTGTNTITSTLGNSTGSGTPTVSVAKSGSGTWILTGNNTYSGGTVINQGTLLINNTAGSATGSGAVNVAGTSSTVYGTLGGGAGSGNGGVLGSLTGGATSKTYNASAIGISSGTVTLNQFATLTPGNNNVGTLTLGTLIANSNSILNYEFNGTANDFTSVTGTLSLTTNIGINLYQEGTTTAFTTSGTYNLFSYGTLGGFSSADFNVLNAVNGVTYSFSNDAAGDMVQLTIVSAVPEPSETAMLLLGISGLAVHVFRRRK